MRDRARDAVVRRVARERGRAGAGEGACVAIGAIGCFLGFPDESARVWAVSRD